MTPDHDSKVCGRAGCHKPLFHAGPCSTPSPDTEGEVCGGTGTLPQGGHEGTTRYACPGCPDCESEVVDPVQNKPDNDNSEGEGSERWTLEQYADVVRTDGRPSMDVAAGPHLVGEIRALPATVEVCRASALTEAEQRADDAEADLADEIERADKAEAQVELAACDLSGYRARVRDLGKQARTWEATAHERDERVRELEAAVENASFALTGGDGPPDTTSAQLWLRTTLPKDHPNYVPLDSPHLPPPYPRLPTPRERG